MGQGYVRNDTINNIADGNIINASDFDGEYDAIEAAFNSSSGHTHDGTAGEGGVVTVLGPAQDFVATTTEIKPKANNTLDIGTSALQFKDLFLDGTANVDGLAMPTTTVTDILDEDNMSTDSATALATQQSIKAYVDTAVGGANELSEILSNGNITAGTGIDFIDNDKLRLGTGNDLEIYHNASNSIIADSGTGSLLVLSNNMQVQNAAGDALQADFTEAGAVTLYHNGSVKFATDAAGANITGQLDISTDLNVGNDLTLGSDDAVINLGADSDVTITHEPDKGIQAKAATGFELNLQTAKVSVEATNVLGKITFNAPNEAGGTDALLDGAAIEAIAEDTFASDNNSTALVFKTNTSGAATERMRIKSDGVVQIDTQVDIDNLTLDGNTITSTDTNGNIVLTPNGTGEVDISKVDIDSGAIDAVTIGTNSAATELQVDNINVNGNAITSTDTDGNIALTPNGTGEVDISKVDIAAGEIDGTTIGANSAAAGTFTGVTLASGATVTAILDEDNMSTDSDTALATQQSIKAYVASQVSGATVTATGITFEGATADSITTSFAIADPQSSNKTFTFADETGTVATREYVTANAGDGGIAMAIALG
jgi:hypothetical protein